MAKLCTRLRHPLDGAPMRAKRVRPARGAAAALQGAHLSVVKAAADRGRPRGFEKLTGIWPGDSDGRLQDDALL